MTSDRRPPTEHDVWREAYRAARPAARETCPEDEVLTSLVLDEPQGVARRRLADHVVACPRCRESYEILRRLHHEAACHLEPRRFGGPRVVAAAVAVFAVLSLTLFIARWDRAPETHGIRGGTKVAPVTIPPDGARLSHSPDHLEWSGPDEVASRRVVLYDEESVPFWESEPTSEAKVALPEAVRGRLDAGGLYYWRVVGTEGPHPHAGPLFRFEVLP